MGPGNYGFYHFTFYPFFLPHYSLFIRENDINVDKNRYTIFGSFLYTFYKLQSSMFGPL